MLLCNLYKQCAVGDLTLAQEVIAAPAPGPASEDCQAGPEPEEFDGDMSDSDESTAEDGALGGAAAASGGGFGAPVFIPSSGGGAAEEGGMDEDAVAPTLESAEDDGWATVKGKGRKGRR